MLGRGCPWKPGGPGVRLIRVELIVEQVPRVAAVTIKVAIPGRRPFDGRRPIPDRRPTELLAGLGAVEAQPLCLVRDGSRGLRRRPGAGAPFAEEPLDDPSHRPLAPVQRTEVPRSREGMAVVDHASAQPEVSRQRLQDVLPWTNGLGITDD